MPAKIRPAGSGYGLVKNLALAALYLALVPVVAAIGISLGATYFPGPTRALLGPALESLVEIPASGEAEKAQEALDRTAAAEDRLAKIEQDIAALLERDNPGEQPAPGGTDEATEAGDEIEALLTPLRKEAAGRDRMLAGLTALTLARAELLAGNRAVAARELTLAQECLAAKADDGAVEIPAQLREALGAAIDAMQRGSMIAGDYLSLAWHLLVDALLTTQ